jgi:hypothetical protein
MKAAPEETVFLDSQVARVTSARLVISNQTFAMSGITSVEVKREKQKRTWIGATLAIMYGIGAIQSNNKPLGLFVLLVGAIWLIGGTIKQPKYNLFIRAAGGEVNALTSSNATDLEIIASAITDAMVHRG